MVLLHRASQRETEREKRFDEGETLLGDMLRKLPVQPLVSLNHLTDSEFSQ